MFSIEMSDLAKIQGLAKKVAEIGGKVRKGIARPLYAGGLEIMAASQKIVPVDTGALRSSGLVNKPEERDKLIFVHLQYGGPAADYAWKVHEDLEAYHPHGQAKYLEEPANQLMPKVSAQVWQAYKDTVKKALEGIA